MQTELTASGLLLWLSPTMPAYPVARHTLAAGRGLVEAGCSLWWALVLRSRTNLKVMDLRPLIECLICHAQMHKGCTEY